MGLHERVFDTMYIICIGPFHNVIYVAHRCAVQPGVECDARQALQVFKTDLELRQILVVQLTIGNDKCSQCEGVRV